MSVLQSVVEYLQSVYDNPLRNNRLKAKEIIKRSQATPDTFPYVMSKITQGDIEGVKVKTVKSDYPAIYYIQSVEKIPEYAVLTTPIMCAEIRRKLKNGDTTRDVAQSMGVDYNTVNTHGRGQCSHDIAEPPAKPIRDGNERSWVEV